MITYTFPLQREIINAHRFLDAFRDAAHSWSVGLFDAATGGFRQNQTVGPNPMSSTDVIWMRYAANDDDLTAPDADAVRTYLQSIQDPVTGRIQHTLPSGEGHVDGHAFWQTVRALNIIGAQLLYPPRFLAPVLDPAGLADWFDSCDWRFRDSGNHHNVLGLVPVLASLDDPAWTEVFFQKIHEQQDPATGVWPVGRPNISRTFAYTALHLAVGRIPPMPERIIDKMLELQQDDGRWDGPPARFHTMDAIYVLTRLPALIGYQESAALDALHKAKSNMHEMFVQNQTHYCDVPHSMLGLLQETFPGEFPSQRPYRFDWDVPALYRCSVITRDMGA